MLSHYERVLTDGKYFKYLMSHNTAMQLSYSSLLRIYSGKGTQPAAICEDKGILCRLRDSKIKDTEHRIKLHCCLWEQNKAHI